MDIQLPESVILTPYENFLYGLKVPETKRQYPNRLDKFMTFAGLQDVTVRERCNKLYELGKNNPELLQSYIIRFITSQKQRIENKEIEGTCYSQENFSQFIGQRFRRAFRYTHTC